MSSETIREIGNELIQPLARPDGHGPVRRRQRGGGGHPKRLWQSYRTLRA